MRTHSAALTRESVRYRAFLLRAWTMLLAMAWLLRLPPASAEDAAGALIKAALEPYVERHELAGAVVLVASKEKVLATVAIGFADVGAQKPMPENALFWIASQSKPMAATAFMMLVDEGKAALEDPVEKYLPEFRGQMVIAEKDEGHVLLKKPSRPIAIRDLLTHTSGLPFSSPLEQPTLDPLPLAVSVRAHALAPLEAEPGQRYRYSNAGINVAARIIEVISGKAYEEFLQERLFTPLGMTDTTFWPTEEQLSRLAHSYKADVAKTALVETTIGQLRYPLTDRARRFPMPAGGLFSSTQDTARFCQMILNGGTLEGQRYLSPAAVQRMTSRQTPPQMKESYGFGWAVGDGWAGHAGAYATNMTVDFKRGLVFVDHVQHAGFPGKGSESHEAFRQTAIKQFGAGQ
jgi:CubicO group peptidase (beta-lactamase class C family)